MDCYKTETFFSFCFSSGTTHTLARSQPHLGYRRSLISGPRKILYPEPHLNCSNRWMLARRQKLGEPQKIGWEAWTRTRIARVRVWSPTNWTTSQPRGDTAELQPVTHKPAPQLNLSRVNGQAFSVNRLPRTLQISPQPSRPAICFLHLGLLANSGHDTFHATRLTGISGGL
jgi:hypothetical protein